MLTHELQLKFISLNKRFASTENPADSKSHKSYTNTLWCIKDDFENDNKTRNPKRP
jgi:hypothetical protein